MAVEDLKKDEMMAHLLDSLEQGKISGITPIGFHYGRRYFLSNDELVAWMTKDKDCDEEKAKSMIVQVEEKNYNPPRRERILEWMSKQDFPISLNPEDPDSCNLYKNLDFPEQVYEHISEYKAQKMEHASEKN